MAPDDCIVEGPRYTARQKKKGTKKRKSTYCPSVADTEEVSRRESFVPISLTGLEDNQAEVDDEFIRSSPYPPPANQKFEAYCVFNGRLTGVFRTWDSTLYQVNGFPCNSYKGYPTLVDAIRAWEHAVAKQTIGPIEDHGGVPPSSRVQTHPPAVDMPAPVVVSSAPVVFSQPLAVSPPVVSQPIRRPSTPSFPRPVIGHNSRVHQPAPVSPRMSISLRRLSTVPDVVGSGLQLGSGAFPCRMTRISSPVRVSGTPSNLSVSSLLTSLSSDLESASSLAYTNLPMVDDNDFYAVITGVEPGVWKGRINSFRRAGGIHGWRVRAATRAEAALIFADAYMAGDIEKFQFVD